MLTLQRTRFRLMRTARKIDSQYVTITAFEEAARCLSFDVFAHATKTRHTLQVRAVLRACGVFFRGMGGCWAVCLGRALGAR